MKDLARLEKEKSIRPSPEIDAFMKVYTLMSVSTLLASTVLDFCPNNLGLHINCVGIIRWW